MTIARIGAFLPPPLAAEHVGSERVDAVEEQQAVEMVDLVLQAARLEALGADVPSADSTAIAVARRTLAVSSGMLRQPSRADLGAVRRDDRAG